MPTGGDLPSPGPLEAAAVPEAESLRVAYTGLNALRIDFAGRKWDTIRTGSLLALGVLTAAAGLLSRSGAPSAAYLAAAVTLPVSALALWSWVRRNLLRESQLLYHAEYSMSQIERLLGLHAPLPQGARWLPGEETIMGPKFTSYHFRTEFDDHDVPDLDQWLKQKLHSHKFIGTIDQLFLVFFIATLGFAMALLCLAYPSFF